MINNKIKKLKKYLFLISIIFLVTSLTHLIYLFLYDDSELVPIKGGAVSEGLVGSFPSLNPLKPLNGNNKYIINLLYKSLLTYDLEEKKIVSDLASCDISNLLKIECYLKDDIYWSNGEEIKAEDVVATYNIIKTTGVNKILSSLLESTTIKKDGNTIVFINEKKDINFLNIFFQPILSKEIIDSIGTDTIFGNFSTQEQLYSGNFIIRNISSDMTIGITKIFLEKNPFNNNGNISQLILKLFPNINSLLQNKESINIFNDYENVISGSVPRLKEYKYTLPQYVSLFINQENIENSSLRKYILNIVNKDDLIKTIGDKNFQKVHNPYLTDKNIITENSNIDLEKIMSSLGYISKEKIISNYLPEKNTYSQEASIKPKESEVINNISEEELKELSIEDFQEDSKYIVKPSYVEKYNFITKDDILLEGKVSSNIEGIYINNYKLSNFKKGNSKFYYRLKESYNSLKEGQNTYKIYFIENGKKVLKEEVNFLYYKDKAELKKAEKELLKKLYLEKNKKEAKKIVKKEKIQINKDDLTKISNLDKSFYYNKDLEKFSLNLYYVSSEKHLEETAFFIQESLVKKGIYIELFPISISNLSKILSDKNKYDLFLTGVNLGYFNYNIFPYFHSSQSKNGYNFSNIKKTSLDILLEDLKSDLKNPEDIEQIQKKVLEILKKEQVIKTLYTPKISLLIDKNIKNISVPKEFINKASRSNIYNNIYINEERIINFENKGFLDFFNFLYKKLNG